ncbi:MAG: GCN5-related N-acetyltransferase [Firmicutes bacterium]|nr:GCN5-related N-acetyltransferase [Bacillota bacterium]
MELLVSFAEAKEKETLNRLFSESDMCLAGEVEDHVVLKEGDSVLAGARLVQMDETLFHLMVFAVEKEKRANGAGRYLLEQLTKSPWAYCREATAASDYTVTTVARGGAASFYQKCGFRKIPFSELPEPFAEQCVGCPEQETCKSMAMAFTGQ